ncbi:hypothetical protein BDZ85DRAFT_283609 [Elsinoe ampelina]|uniref:N-acetyltransferase B complex non catalytic subunit-domain-containing protein n=1 Tax=Elsinoe ampelina TaxID=302913 RepID=A0A6A6G793_9PEZI|nr:hypothetical protein BDZ85DRAFT_283609 [Elsinoe ampelina]
MSLDELDEFLAKKRYKEGLNRADKLVKKANADIIIHVYRARFLEALGQTTKATEVIDALLNKKPTIQDTVVLDYIDEFLLERALEAGNDALTAGPTSLALWKNAATAVRPSFLPILCKDRYESAMTNGRLEDAHHALTLWRKQVPDRASLKFGHAMIYFLIAQKTKDKVKKAMFSQLATRTAVQLASVVESGAEATVIVHVLGHQENFKELIDCIESSTRLKTLVNQTNAVFLTFLSYTSGLQMEDFLQSFIHERMKESDKTRLVITETNFKMWKFWVSLHSSLEPEPFFRKMDELPQTSHLRLLSTLWYLSLKGKEDAVIDTLHQSLEYDMPPAFVTEVRDVVLSLSPNQQDELRKILTLSARHWEDVPKSLEDRGHLSRLVSFESSSLRLEYLMALNRAETVSNVLAFAKLSWSLFLFVKKTGIQLDVSWAISIVTALFRAHELDRSGRWLLAAFCTAKLIPSQGLYPLQVLLCYISQELGMPSYSMTKFLSLGVKEIQLDTASHIGLTRISIQDSYLPRERTSKLPDPYNLVGAALKMYRSTIDRVAEQASVCLEANRPDLVMELESLRDDLKNSIQRRILLLEQRRMERLTNRPQDTAFNFPARTVSSWTEGLADNRDYSACENFESVPAEAALETRITSGGKIPNAAWIHLNLWIDNICTVIHGGASLLNPVESKELATNPFKSIGSSNTGCTPNELALIPAWQALTRPATQILVSPSPDTSSQISTGLTSLKDAIEAITIPLTSPATTTTTPIPHIPTSSDLQQSYLLLDFLRTVLRFCTACTDVTKKRRPGIPIDTKLLRPIEAAVKSKYQSLRSFAQQRQKSIKDADIAGTMIETWSWIATGQVGGRMEELDEGARDDWELGEQWREDAREDPDVEDEGVVEGERRDEEGKHLETTEVERDDGQKEGLKTLGEKTLEGQIQEGVTLKGHKRSLKKKFGHVAERVKGWARRKREWKETSTKEMAGAWEEDIRRDGEG